MAEIAYVKKENNKFEVYLTNVVDNLVVDVLTFSNRKDYESWENGYSSSIIFDPSVSKESELSEESRQSSAPSVSFPQNKEDSAEIDRFKEELSNKKRYFSGGEVLPADPAPEVEDNPQRPQEDVLSGNSGGDVDTSDDDDNVRSAELKTDDAEKETDRNRNQNRDAGALSDKQKKNSLKAGNTGVLNDKLLEDVPDIKDIGGDRIINAKNNQWIVMTRDRPGGINTGYGPGKGHTQAGAIDIVVGRMSPHPRSRNKDSSKLRISPIFNYDFHEGRQVCDAARIYISQKTDIDKNFNLVNGRVGNAIARSGIALKADAVRIIARDSGIKLVTHSRRLMNSQGGKSSRAPSGIDIIAGNNHNNLQPMVLGHNLVAVLREHGDVLDKIVGTLSSVIQNLAILDVALSTHFHPQSFPPGAPNIPSPTLAPICVESLTKLVSMDTFSTFAEKFKIQTIDDKYLKSGAANSVRSSFNNVN